MRSLAGLDSDNTPPHWAAKLTSVASRPGPSARLRTSQPPSPPGFRATDRAICPQRRGTPHVQLSLPRPAPTPAVVLLRARAAKPCPDLSGPGSTCLRGLCHAPPTPVPKRSRTSARPINHGPATRRAPLLYQNPRGEGLRD